MTDVTTPSVPTVATEVLTLLHTPPATVHANVVVPTAGGAMQMVSRPVTLGYAGVGLTVTTAVTKFEQPEVLVTVYVIIAVPAVTPPTIPDKLPTVATA